MGLFTTGIGGIRMKVKKVERTEEKKNGYRESNIRMIREIKSEESQKRINMLVTHCYLKEADR